MQQPHQQRSLSQRRLATVADQRTEGRVCRSTKRFSPSPIKRQYNCRINQQPVSKSKSLNSTNTSAQRKSQTSLPPVDKENQKPETSTTPQIQLRLKTQVQSKYAAGGQSVIAGVFQSPVADNDAAQVSSEPKDIAAQPSKLAQNLSTPASPSSSPLYHMPKTQIVILKPQSQQMLDSTPVQMRQAQKEPGQNSFATPNCDRRRDLKTSEKYDSTIRKTLARDSAQITNFESPVPTSGAQNMTNKQSAPPTLYHHNTEPQQQLRAPKLISSQNSDTKKESDRVGGRWTDAEHRRFLEGLKQFGRDWRLIEQHIGSRNCSQIRSHAQKYFLRLDKLKEEGLQEEGSNNNDDQCEQTGSNLKSRRRSNMFTDLEETPQRVTKFESVSKQDMNEAKAKKSPPKPQRVNFEALDQQSRVVYLMTELENLRQQRNWYCANFLTNRCSVLDVCIALDQIGKKSVDHYLMATVFQNYYEAQQFDKETFLTRFLLKSIIEQLTRIQAPDQN